MGGHILFVNKGYGGKLTQIIYDLSKLAEIW